MNRMREIRKMRGLTMKQLGAQVGASEASISQYETGKHQPDNETLMKIARVLGVSLDYLMGRDEPETDDVWELREQLRRDPEMRTLFSAAASAKPDHIRAAVAMLKALKDAEEGNG